MKNEFVFASGVALGAIGYIALTNKPPQDKKVIKFTYDGTSPLPDEPFHCIVSNKVTTIESYAFYNCAGLITITISDSVKSIGDHAFYNCTGLTRITIPTTSQFTNIGSYAFAGCSSLTPFDISNVENVGKSIFDGCKQTSVSKKKHSKKNAIVNWIQSHKTKKPLNKKPLNEKQELPYHITNSSNDSVKNITFIVGENPKIYLPRFPETPFNLTLLGKYCVVRNSFNNNKYIQSIRFPDTLFRIQSFAFYNCVNLKDVYIGKNVEQIRDTAFKGCPNVYFHVSDENTKFASLNGVLFSKDYTKLIKGVPLLFDKTRNEFIGNNDRVPNQPNKFLWDHITTFGSFMAPGIVFVNSNEIEFPPNLRRIGESALDLCYICATLKTPKYLNKISSYLFKNLSNKYSTSTNITTIIISKSVNIISETAFDSFYGIVEVEKENRHFSSENNAIFNKDKSTLLRYISEKTNGKKYIHKFTVPYGVVNIGDYAFYNSLVEEISIPETVRNIGVGVFNGCKNLKLINFSPTIKLRKFGTYSFYNCYINRCIEIISSPTYRHWTDNNFGNIFLYTGNTRITDYIEGVGLMPDTKVIRNAEKVVKNICKTNKIDIIENDILYNNAINEYKNAAKELIINRENDDDAVERKATIVAITYLAVKSALNNLNDIDINKNYDAKTDEAFKQANDAILNLEPSKMYKEAYTTAYNVYSTAKPKYLDQNIDLDQSKDLDKNIDLDKSKDLDIGKSDFHNKLKNLLQDFEQSEVKGTGGPGGKGEDKDKSNTNSSQTIRITLKPNNRSIITNNKDWPLTNKTNTEALDEACNSIVTTAKGTGATVIGPIRIPNKVLVRHFYANYHIEKNVKYHHRRWGLTVDNMSNHLYTIYIIEPTKKTVDLLNKNNFKYAIKSAKNITKYNNNNKCEYIKIFIHAKCYQLMTKIIIKIINENGALAMHGPLPNFGTNLTTDLLYSKYVDETTREIVKNEICIKRLIDIHNPTAKTVDSLMKLDLLNKVDIEIKV